jgi:hypothetical protein
MNKMNGSSVVLLLTAALLAVAAVLTAWFMPSVPQMYWAVSNTLATLAGLFLAYTSAKAGAWGWALAGWASAVVFLPMLDSGRSWNDAAWIIVDLFFMGLFVCAHLATAAKSPKA